MTTSQTIAKALNAASAATGISIEAMKSKSRKREIVAARVIYAELTNGYPIVLAEVGLAINLPHCSIIGYRKEFEFKWYDPKLGTIGFKEKFDKARKMFSNYDVLVIEQMIAKIDKSLECYTPRVINKAYVKYHKLLEV